MSIRFRPPDSFDDQYQAIELVLCFLALMQIHPFTAATQETRLSIPFPNKKSQLFHRSTLRVQVRNSGQVGHSRDKYYHRVSNPFLRLARLDVAARRRT